MRKRVLFLVTEDWAFWGFRLSLARAVRDMGYEVIVVTRVREHGDRIIGEGFTLVPLEIRRGGLNPFQDFSVLIQLIRIMKKYKPVVVQNVSIKPVLYGTLAARIARVPKIVNLLNGMGFLFTSSRSIFVYVLQRIVRTCIALLLNRKDIKVVVQNHADHDLLVSELGLQKNSVVLIRGSGVDIDCFSPSNEPEGPVRITMVSRLLWDKGVGDLVEAARRLKKNGVECIVTLVGRLDPDNPNSITKEEVEEWVNDGSIEWWGLREDISDVWANSHIAVLPTNYREGLPKCLLEAASCGRAIVSSDIPGCLEIVSDGDNGLVIPAKSVDALVRALEKLVNDSDERRRMGKNGRKKVEDYFAEKIINKETISLYFNYMDTVRDQVVH